MQQNEWVNFLNKGWKKKVHFKLRYGFLSVYGAKWTKQGGKHANARETHLVRARPHFFLASYP